MYTAGVYALVVEAGAARIANVSDYINWRVGHGACQLCFPTDAWSAQPGAPGPLAQRQELLACYRPAMPTIPAFKCFPPIEP